MAKSEKDPLRGRKVVPVLREGDRKQPYVKIIRTPEEKLEIGRKICARVAMGRWTVASICDKYAIPFPTFMSWAQPGTNVGELLIKGEPLPFGCIPEIHELYKKACKQAGALYRETLKEKAKTSLAKRVEGMEYEVVTEDEEIDNEPYLPDGEPNPNYGNMKVVKRKTKRGIIPPDVEAIKFALTNVDPDNFKNTAKFQQTNNTQVNIQTGLENLSDEELEMKKAAVVAELRGLENKDSIAGSITQSDEDNEFDGVLFDEDDDI